MSELTPLTPGQVQAVIDYLELVTPDEWERQSKLFSRRFRDAITGWRSEGEASHGQTIRKETWDKYFLGDSK
jgi:hypothetical protein